MSQADHVAEPLSRTVARALAQAIAEGRRLPGARLSEEEIAAEFGVSRGPVREALRQLVAEGLATAEPRRGVRVIERSAEELARISDIRAVLYGLALRLFATTAPDAAIEAHAAARDMAWAGREPEVIAPQECAALAREALAEILEGCGSPALAETYWRLAGPSHRFHAGLAYARPEARRAYRDQVLMLAGAIRLRDGAVAEAIGRRIVERNRDEMLAQLAARAAGA